MNSLVEHFSRQRHQLGRPLVLHGRNYRLKGYFPNLFAHSLEHEPHVLAVIRHVLAERKCDFIDVGLNNGQTLIKLLEVDPDRRYFGFEPQPTCCAFVTRFIQDNRLAGKHVLPVALSDRTEISHPPSSLRR